MSAPAIEVRALRKTFGEFVAVDDVSFDVAEGEIFGYLGANGAGKSTTIRMLCGLLTPSGGSAMVAGYDVSTASLSVKRSIGYVSQKFSLYRDLIVDHNLEFFGGIYGLSGRALAHAIDHAIERTGLSPYRQSLTSALPGGIRQRVALACAILHEPRIVFLDEPTAGVDPASRRDFWRLIRELADAKTTVFVTTHYMDEAEYCARIGLMVDGALVALDTPHELKQTWVPGVTFAVSGPALYKSVDAFARIGGVRSVEPFGTQLHVRFDAGREDETHLRRTLGTVAQIDRVVRVDATLEDVFLEVASQAAEVS